MTAVHVVPILVRAVSLLLSGGLAVCAAAAMASGRATPAYPAKPLRVIVPFPPGGGTDFVMRALAPHLFEQLGQPVLVDNRAGAQGVVGTQLLARAASDGYTLGIVDAATVIAPALVSPPPFDVAKDFAPIAILVEQPFLVALHPAVPAASMEAFVALVRASPGRYNYGSGSASSHVTQAMFYSMARLDLTHVPYRGNGPLMAAFIGNEVQVSFTGPAAVLPQARAGKLRLIAVTSIRRFGQAPVVPTLDESGFRGVEFQSWFGMLAPAGTPRAVVARLNTAINRILSGGAGAQVLRERGYDLNPATPEAFGSFLATEVDRWSKAIRQFGVKSVD